MHCGKNNLRMVLLLAILGIAMLFCGMATEKSSNIDKMVENISLEQEHSTINLMNFPQIPKCIALNKNGDVAIEYKMNGRTKIAILFSDGERVQYALSLEGNCAIDRFNRIGAVDLSGSFAGHSPCRFAVWGHKYHRNRAK